MHVSSISSQPPGSGDIASVEPQLVLQLRLQYEHAKRIPTDVTAVVRTEDNKFLGVARMLASVEGPAMPLGAAEDSAHGDTSRSVRLVLPLTQKHLDYLEDLREKRPKGDVVLDCAIDVRCLTSKVVNAWLEVDEVKGSPSAKAPVVFNREHGDRNPFVSRFSNMWVLSGDKGRMFMEVESIQQRQLVTIASSDWVHDYLGAWNRTRYVVIELPQPSLLTAAPTPTLQERVNAAIAAAKKATEKMDDGEWSEVVEELRPVWELLRNQTEIEALLARDGFTPEATAALMTSISQQFDLASKFLHSTDRSGRRVNPEIVARKEDATLCYSFAMSVLNMVTRKSARLT